MWIAVCMILILVAWERIDTVLSPSFEIVFTRERNARDFIVFYNERLRGKVIKRKCKVLYQFKD